MGKANIIRTDDYCDAADITREFVLEQLNQLHIHFILLGKLDEAGLLLHQLMEIAYTSARHENRTN
jgi:hypothetical protein